MSKRYKKLITLGICGVLVIASAGAGLYSIKANNTDETALDTTETESVKEDSDESEQVAEDETVYVIAGSDGETEKVIVSDWIENAMTQEGVKQTSYSMDSENAKVWDTDGNDISYSGNIEEELPVNLSVSYELDGEPITAEELIGKSGHVTIRFDYDNQQTQTVSIDGKDETIYVPFIMLTGTMLDNDVFSNVEVSNGKLINDGSRTIVAGIAMPGLQEDLALDQDTIELPDYVEISADVENFEMQNTVTVASNELFSDLDTSQLDSTQDLEDAMDQLTEAMDQLLDGSSQLYTGLSTLLEKSDTLIAGVDKLAQGAKQLDSGADKLSNGTDTLYTQVHNKLYKNMPALVEGVSDLNSGAKSAKEGASKLYEGTKQLSEGLSELTTYNDSLNTGAKEVFETLLTAANTQIAALADYGIEVPTLTIDNYSTSLSGLIKTLGSDTFKSALKSKVEAEVEANRDTIKAQVEESLAGEDEDTINAATQAAIDSMVETNYEAALAQVADVTSQLEDLKASLDEYNTFYTGLADYTAGVSSAADGAATINTNMKKLKLGLRDLYNGTQTLQSATKTLNSGVKSLDQGTKKLDQGASDLSEGMEKLYKGIFKMDSSMPTLKSAISKLTDGSMQLSEGLKQFDEQGIEKVVDLVGTDLADMLTRAKATIEVAKNYQSFSDLEDAAGDVTFIYETDSVTEE
ncbi:hypothetical protein [Eubacterium oxidoreducens]|uniref:Putative membrane protein n=1 Tax=Eubacterium oxidoreducens TaxID=1732 RepID=A0A1G6CDI8_EUBOX|nr:hypothetical protein [Eubacterium oxidoreducens]SDB30802.1 putative membrane protein [Eubacterium oxidoreducens]